MFDFDTDDDLQERKDRGNDLSGSTSVDVETVGSESCEEADSNCVVDGEVAADLHADIDCVDDSPAQDDDDAGEFSDEDDNDDFCSDAEARSTATSSEAPEAEDCRNDQDDDAAADVGAHEGCSSLSSIMSAADAHDFNGFCLAFRKAASNGFQPEDLVRVVDGDGNTALHRCCLGSAQSASEGAVPIAELLFSARADAGAANVMGETPLLAAVRRSGDATRGLVSFLLTARADPERADLLMGETALMEAACVGDESLCLLLLGARADPARQSLQGLTAVDLALEAGEERIAALPGMEASPTASHPTTPLSLRAAVKACDAQAVAIALEGAHALADIAALDGSGRTALHACASAPGRGEAAEIARALLENLSDANARDAMGSSSIEIAVAAGCGQRAHFQPVIRTVRELLSARAEVDGNCSIWSSEESVLSRAADTAVGSAICALLVEFGSSFVWQSQSESAPVEAAANPIARKESRSMRVRCSEHQIPLELIGVFGAAEVLRDCEHWSSLDVQELRSECKLRNLQVDRCYDQAELVSRLRQARIWKALPISALQAECRATASHVVDASPNQASVALAREDLEEALAVAKWGGCTKTQRIWNRCETKGIPVEMFDSIERAEQVLEVGERLELKSISELKAEYKRQGFASDPSLDKQSLLKRLRDYLIWEELPLLELRKVCDKRKVTAPPDLRRPDLLKALIAASWRDKGIPVDRLPSFTVAHGLLDQVEKLGTRSLSELKAECRRRGLPSDSAMDKMSVLAKLKTALIWGQLPVDELLFDCEARGVSVADLRATRSDALRRQEMVKRLILSMWQTTWESRGIPTKKLGDLKAASRVFEHFERIDALSIARLRAEYGNLGLPAEADMSKADYIKRMRNWIIWSELPMNELKSLCIEKGVFEGELLNLRGDAERCKELAERLLITMCIEMWEGKGIPVRRLGNVEAAARIVEEIARLDSLADRELKSEYAKQGFALGSNFEKKAAINRMKSLLVWRELPMVELRRVCNENCVSTNVGGPAGLACDEDAVRKELVQRLIVSAKWADPQAKAKAKAAPRSREQQQKQQAQQPRQPGSGPTPQRERPREPRPARHPPARAGVSPAVQKHLKTLQLPVTAGANEVRRAYRKLALQYHPDKNLGPSQEQASQKFRDVAEAYEGLADFVKLRRAKA